MVYSSCSETQGVASIPGVTLRQPDLKWLPLSLLALVYIHLRVYIYYSGHSITVRSDVTQVALSFIFRLSRTVFVTHHGYYWASLSPGSGPRPSPGGRKESSQTIHSQTDQDSSQGSPRPQCTSHPPRATYLQSR